MSTSVTPPHGDDDRTGDGDERGRELREENSLDRARSKYTERSNRSGNRSKQKTTNARGRREVPWRRIAGIAGVGLVVLAVLWAVVYFTPLFSVKNVEVDGNAHLDNEDVVAAADVAEGTPLAQVNMRQTASNVVSLPWVKSATASRKWPSTISVEVVENVAVAYRDSSEGTHLIDREGKEFAVDTPPEDAVELTGEADADDTVRKDAVDIAAALSDTGRGAVKSIEAKSKYEFVLNLKDDRTVVWGASEDNENKSLAVDTVLQREGKEFNVTNPQLITVK